MFNFLKPALTYPYQAVGGAYFPIVSVLISKSESSPAVSLSGILDSGASISVFDAAIADQLAIDIGKGISREMISASGTMIGFEHKIFASLGRNKPFSFKVIFVPNLETGLNLIGRESFFPRFQICFLEKEKLVRIKTI